MDEKGEVKGYMTAEEYFGDWDASPDSIVSRKVIVTEEGDRVERVTVNLGSE